MIVSALSHLNQWMEALVSSHADRGAFSISGVQQFLHCHKLFLLQLLQTSRWHSLFCEHAWSMDATRLVVSSCLKTVVINCDLAASIRYPVYIAQQWPIIILHLKVGYTNSIADRAAASQAVGMMKCWEKRKWPHHYWIVSRPLVNGSVYYFTALGSEYHQGCCTKFQSICAATGLRCDYHPFGGNVT